MLIIQLIILFLILSIIKSFIPAGNKLFLIVISLFLALLFTIQLSSAVVTGEIADYRFYENFDIGDVISVAGFFGKEGVILTVALLMSILLIYWVGQILKAKFKRKFWLLLSLLIGILVLSSSGGILNNIYHTVQLKFAGNASFNEALSSLQINKQQYVHKENINASKGKNIIVLSLESLEKGYLGDKLKHLTPELSKLAKEHTFYTMKQSPAGGWTSASMYTMITGVPAFFSTHGNSVFQNSYENKLTSLADVLKSAGYDLQYFIGKKEYSGIDDMLKTHGFTVKSEKDFETKYAVVDWGIQDQDLFSELKKELTLKKNTKQPFALFMSTISTHFPNGVPDSRINRLLPPQKSRLELMVSATDYFVGDLVKFLSDQGMLSNTVFYIYPDHLLMGTKSRVLEDFDERSLFLLTNANNSSIDYMIEEDIYQIDLPKIILEGAEVIHNGKFLTDFIPDKDKNLFLRQNDKNILRLNDAALKTLNCKEGIYLGLSVNKDSLEIKNDENSLVLSSILPDKGYCQRILFDENLRPFKDFSIDISQVLKAPLAFAYLDVYFTNNQLYGTFKGKYHFGITKNGEQEVVFDSNDLRLLENIALTQDKEGSITLESNSWNAKKPSRIIIKGKEVLPSRGLTFICFNTTSQQYELRTFDTYGTEQDANDFVKILKNVIKDGAKFIILAHDSAAKGLLPFSEKLKEMGLEKLSKLRGRQAYIMNNLTENKVEIVADASLKINVLFPNEIHNSNQYFIQEKVEFEYRSDRYIAHAAGIIDGIKYTNSKEALDHSYAQGFRLFELDIMETKDNFYVAGHDWNHWAKETGYKGILPVSKNEFLKHKIRGRFSSMDMDGINSWFAAHDDAVLVTDKVNDPKRFAAQFVDKERLMMELFSLPAVEAATSNGVTALLSEKPLSQIKGDLISYLKKHKINHVTLSRRSINKRRTLLKKLRKHKIKVYVYHVNFDSGKDEEYVLNNEIGLVYGMYADKWIPSFKPSKETENK
jgi:sulfatase-like protein